jgi:CRP-like cAMP-binding protein
LPEGNEVTVGPGTLVGELALLTNTVCQATAIAKEPTVVVRIPRNLFRKMLEGYPGAAETLRKSMTERLQAWSKELADVKSALEPDEKR